MLIKGSTCHTDEPVRSEVPMHSHAHPLELLDKVYRRHG
jgi:hypothetical protein